MRSACCIQSLSLALLLAACASGTTSGHRRVRSFEDDAVGAVPRGFVVAETNGQGSPASWRVVPGLDATDPGQVVRVDTENTGSTYNLLLSADDHPADFTMSVYVIPRTGFEDQGGGLAWRARDGDNYYIARWNPLEDNVRLYTVVDGERSMLDNANVTVPPKMWHRLEVTMRGDAIVIGLDGKTLIEQRDATFSGPGRIGLWTKADASTLFDRIEFSTAR